MSSGNVHRKSGVGDMVGQCMLIGGGPSGAIGAVSGRIARQVGILRRFSDRPLLRASIFQSVMPGCYRPRSIGGLHRNDRHGRVDAEHTPAAVETAVGDEDVAVGIETQEIAEGLDGDDGARNGIVLWDGLLEEDFQ